MINWVGVCIGVSMGKYVVFWRVLFVSVLLSSCATVGELKHASMLRGFNAMQHENVGWNQAPARQSLQDMVAVGSNAIVLVAFLEQDSASALQVRHSNAVTFYQLKKAIEYAHAVNLEVILKPQMLVHGAWASAIAHQQQWQWDAWFESYMQHVVQYAAFASQHGVQNFVIGTELSQAAQHVDWPRLIRKVRAVFSGKITYAAHNVAGIKAFPYWRDLDAVAVTLYPSLGNSGKKAEMQALLQESVNQLQLAVEAIDRPLWVLEIGMPSAVGAYVKPWEWQRLKQARVDVQLQATVLEMWLRALDQAWVQGVFIWAWYSDPAAGGLYDSDYTPQNKPAENVIRRYWRLK